MAKEMAKMIWELSQKDDPSIDRIQLKDVLWKIVETQKRLLRNKLKQLVIDFMENNNVGVVTEMTLTSEKIEGGKVSNYSIRKATGGDDSESIFLGERAGQNYIVVDPASCFLIQYAILPLGLTWRLNGNNYIIISWKPILQPPALE